MQRYNVHPRSIQRDIKDITDFLERDELNTGVFNSVIYDTKCQMVTGFNMNNVYKLSPQQILAICKILLDSRAFVKEEMSEIIDKLIHAAVDQKRPATSRTSSFKNEEANYVELQHKTRFLRQNVGHRPGNPEPLLYRNRIQTKRQRDKKTETETRSNHVLRILFLPHRLHRRRRIYVQNFEVANDSYPTIYRIDRIQKPESLSTTAASAVPYGSRFEEGEFRKRVQFMYGGKLQTVRFKYKGPSIEAVLDRSAYGEG